MKPSNAWGVWFSLKYKLASVSLGFAACATLMAQTPPTLSAIRDQGTYPNSTNRLINFVIDDAETPPSQLTLAGTSSNPTIVPNSGLIFGGSQNNRTLSVIPAANQTGAVSITLTVTDKSGMSTSNSFALDVNYLTPLTNGLPTLVFAQAAWGDYDNDGDLDVVIAGDDTNATVCRIYRNDGGTFTDINAGLAAVNRSELGWADYDNDGWLDLLITGGSTHLYHNNGDGTFTEVATSFPAITYGAFAWGDMDNDGDLDLLLTGTGIPAQIWRNEGNGNFVNLNLPLPSVYFSSAAWGDYDNDGDLDFLISGYGGYLNYVTKLYRNDNKGVFTEVPTGLAGVYGSTTAWGDYDNDGDLDILLSGRDTNYLSVCRIYRNDAGTFTNINAGLTGGWLGRGAWGDFDNDGYLDAVVAGRDGSTKLYRNNRNQTFSEVPFPLVSLDEGITTWSDFDRDGDLDLLIIGNGCFFGCPLMQLYRNNGPTNTPPSTPTALTVTMLSGNDVALRWNASTDALTASNGLSYNLRIGTNSGGIQVMSPQSDLANGFRRVPQPGLAHTNRWMLVDVAKGTYYWSVQAVDPTFAGSPFSAEGSFTITNSRPVISAPPALTTFPAVAVSNISFTVGDAETAATSLVVTKSSANTNLLPEANILLGGSGSNRTVTLIPPSNRSGDAVVTLTVTDAGGLTQSTNLTLRISSFTTTTSITPALPGTNFTLAAANWFGPMDYDRDGQLDWFYTREFGDGTNTFDETIALHNNGNGSFTEIPVGWTNLYAGVMGWGDVDNDGWLEFAIIGRLPNGTNVTRLYHNDGAGHFNEMPVALPQMTGGAISFVDLNNDGYADLFLTGNLTDANNTGVTKILLNTGTGSFKELANDLPVISAGNPWGTTRFFWMDEDGDGDLDLFASCTYIAGFWRNDGGGHFTDIISALNWPWWGTGGAAADLNNDGWVDVMFAGRTNIVNQNLGNTTFTSGWTGIPDLSYVTTPVLGDLDNDGWPDVLITPPVVGNAMYHNNGYLTFTLAETNLPGGLLGDLDGDNDLDVFSNGTIYWNKNGVPNTPPTAPGGLSAVQLPGNAVQLTWSRGSDAQTTNAAGLFYNLRVGTTPGGIEVMSPLADTATGRRQVVGFGNASFTNRWVFRNLPRGNYYWGVQAIDGSFAGSPFSTNATFSITRPDISDIPDQIAVPGFPLAPIPFTITDVETPAGSLTLSASVTDTNLVALTNIVFLGTGTNRTATITPTPGLTGTNLITITVTDGDGYSDSTTFTLIVEPFLPSGNLSLGSSARIFPADYNNDGLMDVLVSANPVQLWRNLGNGNFTNDAVGLPASNNGPAAWGDYDNDGWLDLVFSDSTNIYHNDGTNHFTPVPTTMTAPGYYANGNTSVSWGDYDGDGKLDVMRMGWGFAQLYRNLGNGVFTNSGFTPQWGQVGSMGWADLNNDGKLDLFVCGDFTGGGSFFTYIYRGNAGTNLTLVVSNTIVGIRWSTVAFRDADADGDLDILLTGDRNSSGNQTCRIYRNDGNFTFTNYVELAVNSVRNSAWGDYSNDGQLDVLGYGMQPTTVLVNQGDGTYSNLLSSLSTVGVFGAAWADFDNDGDLDVVADKLYLNLRPLTNQPPAAPTGLSVNVISNTAALSWNAPLDDTTPSNALTYAVRLGTNAGGSQIFTADADPATGFRRIVPDVNTWPNRWRLVKDLPDGTYFWSVQAIDSGYAGSPFAAEASFSYFHPTISGPTDVVAYAGAPATVVPLVVGDTDSDAATLTLTAFFTNTNLLNATNFLFSGAGSNRTLTLTLPPGAVGTSMVNVVVMDLTGLTATNRFRFESSYFSDVTPVFSGGNYYNAHWADFDNDNDLDVFYGGFIYRNDGSNGFTLVASPGGANRNGVVWGDYDRDGDLDFAWTDGATLKIFRNDAGVFVNTGQNIALGGAAALAWGDFDNDGDLDLAVTQPSASRLYRNDAGVFTLTSASLSPSQNGAVAWGDFDNDGDQDLLIAGLGYGPTDWRAEIYRNDGGGVFTAIGAGLFGTDASSVAWGDIDNDGRLDALVTGFNYGSYVLKVYHNNGNGTFTDLNLPLQGVAYSDAGFGDFDNDGWLDIHLNGCKENYCATSLMAIYRNNHDGTFSDLNAGLPPTTVGQVGVGDFDNDGDLDLLADRLYRNNCTVSNSPPTTPLAPAAELLGDNAVRLNWSPSSDLETTNAAGLSYEIRVGTTPGGVDYASPGADLASGYRRVPQRGAQNLNFSVLRDVPKGTYYWSVQAIDATFAGSPFSTEGSFTITNARPLISAISNQVTVPGRATPPVAFTIFDEETDAANLTLTRLSLNTSLVPTTNIVFGGSGSNRTVTVTPVGSLSGTATIVIGVMDAQGLVATSRFDVVVQNFTEISAGLPLLGTAIVPTAWGDYDNDGDLDVAIGGTAYTTIYRNTGGLFTNQGFTLPAASSSDLAWLDLDNDGDLDLAESGWTSAGYMPVTYRFRNDFPVNRFTSISTNLPGLGTTNIADGAMAWADYDNDGDLDVVLCGDTNTYHVPDAFTALYRNDHGVFTNSGVALPALVKGAAAWGDYDNDGDLDLLLAGQTGSVATNSVTKLFRNNGNGTFTEIATPFPGVTDCALAWGDFDNDGDLDVALAGMGTNAVSVARIYRNLGNGVFTNLNASLTGVTLASVAWGDFDNDGFADLVMSGSTNIYNSGGLTKVYHNNGGASFTDIGGTLPGVAAQNTSWGDYDNDGDLDLLAGTRLARNNWNFPDTPPTTPTNLSFLLLSNNAVQLAWSPSSDLETTNARGLSYNLRLGTNSGGSQIISALSDFAKANGYRRVPQSGNAGQTNAWRIFNLANGTYYWSVQAVDPSFAGSAFATEETFTLSRPVFSAITNRSVAPNTVVNIGYTVSDAETARSNLVLSAWSSDTNLVANENLLFTTNGIVPTLTVTPATNRSGSATITIVATDENNESGSVSFQITYERFSDINAGLSALVGQVAWGDYDSDGDLDLVRGSTIYRNNGDGSFTDIVAGLSSSGVMSAAWSDYDNDGNLDLLIVGSGFRGVYRNNGEGVFTSVIPNAGGNALTSLAWGDYDNDGDQDFLFAYSNYTYLYRNDGNNVFTQISPGLPIVNVGSVAWCDYDKDGDLDILLAGGGLTRVYRNNGNGTFTDIAAGLPTMYYPSVAWGDFDNDGWMDFAVAGSTNNSVSGVATRLYRNCLLPTSGSRQFTNMPSPQIQGVWKGAIAWGDYDGDGDLDLLVSGEINAINGVPFTRLYRNDNGNFVDSGHALPALRNTFAAWGDYDGDGALDLALSGNDAFNASISRIYRNYANGITNPPPNALASLTNVVFRKSVRLSWGAAADANQSAAALTYNLRVGTSPGAGNIFNPLSLADGSRKIPALGNTQERQSWTLTNLTGGTFYWSVQAVDHAFAGSPFAAEGSFVVTNLPPVALAKSATLNEDSSVGISFTGSDPDGDSLTYNVATQPVFGTLSGTPPNVTYTPRPDYFGLDLFTYRANDRTTDSVPAQVVIQVIPVADTTNFSLAIQPQAGGQIQLSLNAEPWNKYGLQASEDLAHWTLLTNVVTTNQLKQIMDADAAQFAQRFYRAAWLPFDAGFGLTAIDSQGFHLSVLGETGRVYQVRYSSDLTTWTTLSTFVLTNTPQTLVDPSAAGVPQRFYRVIGP